MDVLNRLFGRSGSASTAKHRLQLVLTQDRTNISPETLNLLKDEIIAAISKHIEIDSTHVEVSIAGGAEGHRLTANIPVIGTRKPRRRSASATEPSKS
jgi:cell division topological specificity factor